MWGQNRYPAAGHAQEISEEPSKPSPMKAVPNLVQLLEGTQKWWQ